MSGSHCSAAAAGVQGTLTVVDALHSAVSGLLAESGTVIGKDGKQYAWRINGAMISFKWKWRFFCTIDGHDQQLAETKSKKGAQEHGFQAMQQRGL